MAITRERLINIRECVEHHDGKFPKNCFTSGVTYWKGERIEIDEFLKAAKQWRQSK